MLHSMYSISSPANSNTIFPAAPFPDVRSPGYLNLKLSVAYTGAPSNLTKVKEKVRELNVQLDNLCQV